MSEWFVYMLECSDGSIYTGMTNNLKNRIVKHNSRKGAKYTRGRTPVSLKAAFIYKSKSEALKAEYSFKQLSRVRKQNLIKKLNKVSKGRKISLGKIMKG